MRKVRLSAGAVAQLRDILLWSEERFGRAAALRYDRLIRTALEDLATNPHRIGVKVRTDLAPGTCTYHLVYSRTRARCGVRRPRHLLLFRVGADVVDVAAVLHDAVEITQHLPPELTREEDIDEAP